MKYSFFIFHFLSKPGDNTIKIRSKEMSSASERAVTDDIILS